jgi:tRNA threonylcarbamoyladenosine biosynthesis protein TsaE
MKNIITTSARQTFNFAKKIAKKLKGGEVIALVGELGAGKTIFTKGLAAGLGIKKNITSPTFVLMKIYKVKSQKSKVKSLIHIDAYRLKSAKDILAIGAEEYFGRPGIVTVIEWADRVKKILPRKAIFVKIISKENNQRIINIKKYGF